jgi:hypothetical protein
VLAIAIHRLNRDAETLDKRFRGCLISSLYGP